MNSGSTRYSGEYSESSCGMVREQIVSLGSRGKRSTGRVDSDCD